MTSPSLPLQNAAFVDARGQLTIAARTFLRLLQQEQVTMTEVIVQIPEFADEIAALQQAMLNKQDRDGDLDAISDLSTTGFAARTDDNEWALRTITGTADQITVEDGDGVDDDPVVSLADLADGGTGAFKLLTRDAKGRLSGTADGDTDDVPEGATNLYFTDARAIAAVEGMAGGEILVSDTDSAPPVMLTNEAEDDFLYSD